MDEERARPEAAVAVAESSRGRGGETSVLKPTRGRGGEVVGDVEDRDGAAAWAGGIEGGAAAMGASAE
jgi:hypothetical protein